MVVPALLEVQRSIAAQLLGAVEPESELLAIYRNTALSTLVNALRLSYPAVQCLVGAEFFEGAAHEFIPQHAPDSAYLNDYGARFAQFLAQFPHAATLPYLADVARLEWAVNRALHAPDVPALDVSRFSGLNESALATVSFTTHPSLSVLKLQFPADAIWRAVLDQDSEAMASVDLSSGPIHLLVERDRHGVQVRRMSAPAWQFTASLSSGNPLFEAIAGSTQQPGDEINALLADHLASGRFVDFSWTGESPK
jgi:hypothetical protein